MCTIDNAQPPQNSQHGRRGPDGPGWAIEDGRKEKKRQDIPIEAGEDLVEVFATLLAVVFIGQGVVVGEADAGAVLPDLADVALNEEAGEIFANICRIYGLDVKTVFCGELEVVK